MRILLVEDDELIGMLVVSLLEEHHEVVHVADGRDGLLRLAKERFDLAILDVDLPTLRGIGVAQAVRDFSTVPLVVTSAGMSWEHAALEAGASACLPKPFATKQLEQLIASFASVLVAAPVHADVAKLGPDDLARLAALPREQLDALPFGALALGPDGRIEEFNAYEASSSGRARDAVIGRHFSEIAPCTIVKKFAAAHETARAQGNASLRYVFPRDGATSVVTVRFHVDAGRTWIFVSRVPDVRPLAKG